MESLVNICNASDSCLESENFLEPALVGKHADCGIKLFSRTEPIVEMGVDIAAFRVGDMIYRKYRRYQQRSTHFGTGTGYRMRYTSVGGGSVLEYDFQAIERHERHLNCFR